MSVVFLESHALTVEIAPGADRSDPVASWPWVDITDRVMVDDGISIEVGRSDESTSVDPGRCQLVVDNSNGDFCRMNPVGTWYPDLTRNTPLRVKVNSSTRFLGEIAELPPRWDKSGNHATASITAAGLLRKIAQGSAPLRSVAYRTLTAAENSSDLVAYWPLEEESGATAVSSPKAGARTPVVTGEIDFGADTSSASSERLLRFGDEGQIIFTLPFYSSNEHKIISLWRLPEAGLTTETILMRVYCADGSIGWFDLVYSTPWALRLDWYSQGSLIDTTNVTNWSSYIAGGSEFFLSIELTGPNISTLMLVVEVPTGDTGTGSDTVAGSTDLGRIDRIVVGYGGPEGASFGQLAVGLDTGAFPNYISPVNGALGTQGFAGERAADRIERLCTEESLGFTLVGDATDTTAMGAQAASSLLDLLREAEVTDDGVLYEDANGLAYQTHVSRYNATVAMTLDFEAGQIAEAPTPADDDQQLRNDVTVTRSGGGSARYEATGDYAPTGAIGRYDEGISINSETDEPLARYAEWAVHEGTVDELRWPQLDLNLARSPELVSDWLASGTVGSRIIVENPPVEVGPADLDLFVEGYVEQLGWNVWRVTANCTPASPWSIAVIEGVGPPVAPGWILDSANSTLDNALNSTDLVFDVGVLFDPGWTNSLGDPVDIEIGGEQITISSISGFGVTWTFTASARSVNGAVKSHPAGSVVRLWRPPVLSRS